MTGIVYTFNILTTQQILEKHSMNTPIYTYLNTTFFFFFNFFPTTTLNKGAMRSAHEQCKYGSNQKKNFTSVNTLHILQALAKFALKTLHLHLLLISNIHRGYANTKQVQELMFPLESTSFI